MVDIIASRVAAIKLSSVIAALLLPLLFIGYFLVSSLQKEADIYKHETDGSMLIHLLIPVYLAAVGDTSNPADIATLLEQGPKLAADIGEAATFDNLADVLKTPKPYPAAIMANSLELISRVGESSGMILDPEPETYHLAVASTSSLPKLVAHFKELQMKSKRAAANGPASVDGLSQLLLDAGMLNQSGLQAGADIEAAGRSTLDDRSYAAIANLSSAIKFRLSTFGVDIRKSFAQPDSLAPAAFFNAASMSGPMIEEFSTLWSSINDRFRTLTDQRRTSLSKKMSIIILVSFGSCVIGLGLAITMFQSTLKRLDGVEAAKKDADHARDEAEEMADRVSSINEEMVRVNQELGSNMQKLKDAQDALVKKGRMEQMGQLTATIAHELRNPLGAVRTSAFLLERKIKDKGLGVESQFQRINNGITRCDNIITQLLDFSRTKQLATRAADLDEWLAKIIEEEAKQLPSAVAIDCLLGLDGRNVPFDPSRMQRAITNLVSNASEAMVGNGDDPSRFATPEPHILISTKIVDDMVVISVKDNGPGITEENLGKIREPLFTTKSFGTGLGLPAVEQIASQHGGTLEITSVVGRGATFAIKLPLTIAVDLAA
jgi:signal transduction histidine kinase